MDFITTSRYGADRRYEDPSEAPAAVEKLIRELETEEFEEPDDEHTQVAVSFGDWSVTAQVSGLLTLSDQSGITGSPADPPVPALHLRAVSRSQVTELLIAMAEGRLDEVRRAGWMPFDRLPPYQKDLFRK